MQPNTSEFHDIASTYRYSVTYCLKERAEGIFEHIRNWEGRNPCLDDVRHPDILDAAEVTVDFLNPTDAFNYATEMAAYDFRDGTCTIQIGIRWLMFDGGMFYWTDWTECPDSHVVSAETKVNPLPTP